MEGRGEVLIFSSNNYLGLCDEPSVVQAGVHGLEKYGAGTGSVRFICGTFTVHRELEHAIAGLVGTDATARAIPAHRSDGIAAPSRGCAGRIILGAP